MEDSPQRVTHTQVDVQYASDKYAAYTLHTLRCRSSGGECQRDYIQRGDTTRYIETVDICGSHYSISLRYGDGGCGCSTRERRSEILREYLLGWATWIAVFGNIGDSSLRLNGNIQLRAHQLSIVNGIYHVD